MLRRSTSFDTRPMPMKIAMNNPKTDVAARPRSLMIFTSCPAVSWPRRYDDEMRRTAKSTRLYSTRSLTDSRNTLTATTLTARTEFLRLGCARAGPHLRDTLQEEVFQRVSHGIERYERCACRGQFRKDPVRR